MDNEPLIKQSRLNDWINIMQEHGCRITQPRFSVLQILSESTHAIEAVEIFDQARKVHPKLSLVSVYRTLEKMEELELVTRVHRDEHCHAFVAGLEGHQHLLICQTCGMVFHFQGDDIHDLMKKVALESGFTVTSHWLQLFGQCQECLKIKQKY